MTQSIDTIVGIPVEQNRQEFIIGVFTISQVLKFTTYTSRLILSYDDDNMPIYNNEIQRNVEKSRVETIADFLINDPEATFPTNIVLHIPIQVVEKQEKVFINEIAQYFVKIDLSDKVFYEVKKEKTVRDSGDIYVSIIDGQHRIKGIEIAIKRLQSHISSLRQTLSRRYNVEIENKLSYYTQRLSDLLGVKLVVSFFIDKSLDYQAMIFSTINRTQKRVSQSLVLSLFGLSLDDTPQKTSLEIVLALNGNSKSPFFKRIKLYGGTYERNQSPPLSQATMIKSIVDLICENPREAENDRFKKRKELLHRSKGINKPLPFRRYYASNEDTKITLILINFFSAVKDVFVDGRNVSYWNFQPESMEPTNILHTTVGYLALLKLLVEIIEREQLSEEKKISKENYAMLLNRARQLNLDNFQRYPLTSKAKNIFYLDLSLSIWKPLSPDDPRKLKLEELLKEL